MNRINGAAVPIDRLTQTVGQLSRDREGTERVGVIYGQPGANRDRGANRWLDLRWWPVA